MSIKLCLATCLVAVSTTFSTYAQEIKKIEKPAKPAESALKIIVDGVEPGAMTQDYDAAIKYAKEKELPVFIVFTGSDWCHWCTLMEQTVFSRPEWSDFAKDNLVMIYLDFPRDANKVPQKYRARNGELREKYAVTGYPTYIVLDYDGKRIGQLGAERNATVNSFKKSLSRILIYAKKNLKNFCDKLKPEDAAIVMECIKAFDASKTEKEKVDKEIQKIRKDANTREEAALNAMFDAKSKLDKALDNGKMNLMSPEKKKAYKAAKENVSTVRKALEDWIKVHAHDNPTPELRKKYMELNNAIKKAQEVFDAL